MFPRRRENAAKRVTFKPILKVAICTKKHNGKCKKRAYKEAAESPEHVKHDVFYAVSPETMLNMMFQPKNAPKNNV